MVGYDGSVTGPEDAKTTVTITSPRAFVRLLRAPRGLGLARAWVSGDVQIEGDLNEVIAGEGKLERPAIAARVLVQSARIALRADRRAWLSSGATEVEYKSLLSGRHSVASDLRETSFHYDVSNAFYEVLLGPSLTYSCGIYQEAHDTLEDAQHRKHQLIADKLQLGPESHVLDIGCGWGSFLVHAARDARCRVTGFTASKAQAEAATERLRDLPTARIHHADYRQLLPHPATAVVSIGMYEHVGQRRSPEFFGRVLASLPPGGRYLNQAIVRRENWRPRFRRNSFAQRYIFPNAQIRTVSAQVAELDQAGFRVLSVETFGPSYARTLRAWSENLAAQRDVCVKAVGEARVRAWEMYLAGSRARFEAEHLDLAQVLAVRR